MSTPKRRYKRVIVRQQVGGANDVLSFSYSTSSSSLKTSDSYGPEFKKVNNGGMGAIIANSSPVSISPGTPLAIYNNTTSVQWVNMNRSEDGPLTAPSGLSNAIPLAPNSWTYLNMGENDQIQTSSANVGIYVLVDDTDLQILPITDPY